MLLQIGLLFACSHFSSIAFIHHVFSKSQKITEKPEHNVTKMVPITYIDGLPKSSGFAGKKTDRDDLRCGNVSVNHAS